MKTHFAEKKFATGLLLLVMPLATFSQPPPTQIPIQDSGAKVFGMDDPNRVPGSYIVVMKKNNKIQANLNAFSAVAGLSMTKQYTIDGFQGFAAEMTDTAVEEIKKNPNVDYIEADGLIEGFELPWGVDRIDQHDLPLNATFNPAKSGRGVNVYVVDSGIRRTHQEFVNRVAAGVNFVNDNQGTNDCHGHGTHVSGTISGSTTGIARNATIIPVRVLDCNNQGLVSNFILGINWVTNNIQHPAVVNLSLGSKSPSKALDDAVRASISQNINYTIAAGNSNEDACLHSPARVNEAITVGATTDTDHRASFSNWGNCVDIFSPGENILSAINSSDSAYTTFNGTSMAAPHVAGAVAAMLTVDPLYPSEVVKPYSIERRIKACSTKFAVINGKSINNHLLHLCIDEQFEFGDVNGDKKQDLIRFGEKGVEVALAPANLSGFLPFKPWIANFGYNSGWRTARHLRRVADVNGDGKADIVGFGETGVYVATSTGTKFTFKGKWITDYSYSSGAWRIAEHERRVADVNGDKRADLIGFGNFGVYVALSTGSSFATKVLWSTDFNPTTGWNKRQHVRHVADIDGDKKADIVGFGGDGVHVALSSGSSFDYKGRWIDDFAIGAGGWSVYRHERQLGDVNGDGKADIVGFGERAVYVSLSTGMAFAPVSAPQPDFNYESGWRVADTYSPFHTLGTSSASLDEFAVAHPRFVTDYTGNGKADIIGLGNVNKPFKEAAFAAATSFGFGDKFILTVPNE